MHPSGETEKLGTVVLRARLLTGEWGVGRDAELVKSQPWPPFEKRNKPVIMATKVSPSISRA